jgi:hypothetical protein
MTVYKRKERSPMVWVFGLLLFILTMTITFADVNGFNIPVTDHSKHKNEIKNSQGNGGDGKEFDQGDHHNVPPTPPTAPAAVPEPGTLMLVAAGLGLGSIKAFRKRTE